MCSALPTGSDLKTGLQLWVELADDSYLAVSDDYQNLSFTDPVLLGHVELHPISEGAASPISLVISCSFLIQKLLSLTDRLSTPCN